jgi:hypothetical protein
VARIGNGSINFDSNDRIRRIGSIVLQSFALERVGGLEIIYNRRGQVVDNCKGRGMHITKTIIGI